MGMPPVGVWNWIGSLLICLWHVGETSLLQGIVAVVVMFPSSTLYQSPGVCNCTLTNAFHRVTDCRCCCSFPQLNALVVTWYICTCTLRNAFHRVTGLQVSVAAVTVAFLS